jgi:hypothetical protein
MRAHRLEKLRISLGNMAIAVHLGCEPTTPGDTAASQYHNRWQYAGARYAFHGPRL